jgi:hypothetical protein
MGMMGCPKALLTNYKSMLHITSQKSEDLIKQHVLTSNVKSLKEEIIGIFVYMQ